MQTRTIAILFFIFTLFAVSVPALPAQYNERAVAVDVDATVDKRSVSYPLKITPQVKADIVAQVKANIHASVLARIVASVSEQVKASIDVKVQALGGIVSIGDLHLDVYEKAALNKLQVSLAAAIDVKLNVAVYADIAVYLDSLLGGVSVVTEAELLAILVKLEAKVIALLKIKLPEICADLKADIQAAVNLCIDDLQVNIPAILNVDISAHVHVQAIVKACVKLVVKLCADLSATVSAKAIIAAL